MTVSLSPLSDTFAVEVHGVDLSEPLLEDAFDIIELAFYEQHVLVFRDQALDPEALLTFGSRFGPLTSRQSRDSLRHRPRRARERHDQGAHVPGFPEIAVHANIDQSTDQPVTNLAARYWHTDRSYTRAPSIGAALYAIEVPFDGTRALGGTSFANAAAAYDCLSRDMKARLEGLYGRFSATHMMERLRQDGYATEEAPSQQAARRLKAMLTTTHRLVQAHPYTDDRFLFVSPAHLESIAELDQPESTALMKDLFEHVTDERFVYHHEWRPGDLLMWHNLPTLHRASFDYEPSQRRVLNRIAIYGPDIA